MSDICFVVPCKYNQESGFLVFNCVESIRNNHPDADIYVVDSDSDDISYLQELKEDYGIIPLDVKNKNYSKARSYFDKLDPTFEHQLIFNPLKISLINWSDISDSSNKQNIDLIKYKIKHRFLYLHF